jgi:quinol monooxygenase YgiN
MKKSKSDLIVIASVKAKPGKEKELETALLEAAKPTRKQTGCVSFSLYKSNEDSTIIIGFERWATAKDHDKHLQGTHVQILMSKMANILSEPPKINSYKITDEE